MQLSVLSPKIQDFHFITLTLLSFSIGTFLTNYDVICRNLKHVVPDSIVLQQTKREQKSQWRLLLTLFERIFSHQIFDKIESSQKWMLKSDVTSNRKLITLLSTHEQKILIVAYFLFSAYSFCVLGERKRFESIRLCTYF